MKIVTMTSAAALLYSVPALAQTCTQAPSCSSLGYTQRASACSGKYLVCPFDSTLVMCIPELTCASLGYTKSASDCGTAPYIPCPTDSNKVICSQTADVCAAKGYYKTLSSDHYDCSTTTVSGVTCYKDCKSKALRAECKKKYDGYAYKEGSSRCTHVIEGCLEADKQCGSKHAADVKIITAYSESEVSDACKPYVTEMPKVCEVSKTCLASSTVSLTTSNVCSASSDSSSSYDSSSSSSSSSSSGSGTGGTTSDNCVKRCTDDYDSCYQACTGTSDASAEQYCTGKCYNEKTQCLANCK